MAVLEAKLDSIPGLDGAAAATTPAPAVPNAAGAADPSTPAVASTIPSATSGNAPPATTSAAPVAAPVEAAAAPPANPGLIAVKDHPDYKPYTKLLKVGIPLQAAKNKLMAAGQFIYITVIVLIVFMIGY